MKKLIIPTLLLYLVPLATALIVHSGDINITNEYYNASPGAPWLYTSGGVMYWNETLGNDSYIDAGTTYDLNVSNGTNQITVTDSEVLNFIAGNGNISVAVDGNNVTLYCYDTTGSGSDTWWNTFDRWIYNNSGTLSWNETFGNATYVNEGDDQDTNETPRVDNLVSSTASNWSYLESIDNHSATVDTTFNATTDARVTAVNNSVFSIDNHTATVDTNETPRVDNLVSSTASNWSYMESIDNDTDTFGDFNVGNISTQVNLDLDNNNELYFNSTDNNLGISALKIGGVVYINLDVLITDTNETPRVDDLVDGTVGNWSYLESVDNHTATIDTNETPRVDNLTLSTASNWTYLESIDNHTATIDTNETDRVDDLVTWNVTTNTRVDDVNTTAEGKASPGTCTGNNFVQNTTTTGVQCATPSGSTDTRTNVSNTSTQVNQVELIRFLAGDNITSIEVADDNNNIVNVTINAIDTDTTIGNESARVDNLVSSTAGNWSYLESIDNHTATVDTTFNATTDGRVTWVNDTLYTIDNHTATVDTDTHWSTFDRWIYNDSGTLSWNETFGNATYVNEGDDQVNHSTYNATLFTALSNNWTYTASLENGTSYDWNATNGTTNMSLTDGELLTINCFGNTSCAIGENFLNITSLDTNTDTINHSTYNATVFTALDNNWTYLESINNHTATVDTHLDSTLLVNTTGDTMTGNLVLTDANVTATQFYGLLSCYNITDGSDGNFCSDATAAGGTSIINISNTTSNVSFDQTSGYMIFNSTNGNSTFNIIQVGSDVYINLETLDTDTDTINHSTFNQTTWTRITNLNTTTLADNVTIWAYINNIDNHTATVDTNETPRVDNLTLATVSNWTYLESIDNHSATVDTQGFNETMSDSGLNSTGQVLDVNSSMIQSRVTGTCNGQVMVNISEDGTVGCEADDTSASAYNWNATNGTVNMSLADNEILIINCLGNTSCAVGENFLNITSTDVDTDTNETARVDNLVSSTSGNWSYLESIDNHTATIDTTYNATTDARITWTNDTLFTIDNHTATVDTTFNATTDARVTAVNNSVFSIDNHTATIDTTFNATTDGRVTWVNDTLYTIDNHTATVDTTYNATTDGRVTWVNSTLFNIDNHTATIDTNETPRVDNLTISTANNWSYVESLVNGTSYTLNITNTTTNISITNSEILTINCLQNATCATSENTLNITCTDTDTVIGNESVRVNDLVTWNSTTWTRITNLNTTTLADNVTIWAYINNIDNHSATVDTTFNATTDGRVTWVNDTLYTIDNHTATVDTTYNATTDGRVTWVNNTLFTIDNHTATVDTNLNGTSAGGDIEGDYPSPTIVANAVQDDEIDYSAVTLSDFDNDQGFYNTEANLTSQLNDVYYSTKANLTGLLSDTYYSTEANLTGLLDDNYLANSSSAQFTTINITTSNNCVTFIYGGRVCANETCTYMQSPDGTTTMRACN